MSHSREQSDSDTTVLIAEDDPVFRRLLSMAVARLGVKVETACDGEEAYQRLQQGGITFLVLDHPDARCTGIRSFRANGSRQFRQSRITANHPLYRQRLRNRRPSFDKAFWPGGNSAQAIQFDTAWQVNFPPEAP